MALCNLRHINIATLSSIGILEDLENLDFLPGLEIQWMEPPLVIVLLHFVYVVITIVYVLS